MSGISTHVLDVARGQPAEGVEVHLEKRVGDAWIACGAGVTNADGRCPALLAAEDVTPGDLRLTFATGGYFQRLGQAAFFPEVTIVFRVGPQGTKYHVPLLLSPFGYSTYRGS
jgi:5-hydroxyisourate hydrolase